MNDTRFIFPSLIVGAALILSTIIGAITFYKIRSFDNNVTVTGSAKTSVVADMAKWNASITRTVKASTLKDGYGAIAKDAAAVDVYMTSQGFSKNDYTISPVFMNEDYSYNNQNYNSEKQYNLVQNISLSSSSTDQVTATANGAASLAGKGVLISTNSLEYYYSKLPDLRVSLLSDAIKDAKARAEKLAESSGKKVGALKSASSGVVQVTAPNSVDVSDYGSYDTQSVNKDIMVTVKASFVLQ